MTTIRVAMTQTCNAYADMPDSVEALPALATRLEAIREANLQHHVELLTAAHNAGAQIVGLGELFSAPYFALRRDAFWKNLAESAESGPTVQRLRRCAKDLQLVLIVPIYEYTSGGLFNTAVVIDADGQVLGKYRKCHIPQGENEQGSFDEVFYYGRSDGQSYSNIPQTKGYFPVFNTAVGRVGVSICYDRHFEGVVAALVRGGAQLIFSPAVTFGEKSRRMWDIEFEVDAARHRVFIGGSNRCGIEKPWNQEYFGQSHFVGPNGRLENKSTHTNLVIADIDLGQLDRPDSSGWDLGRDARPDIY